MGESWFCWEMLVCVSRGLLLPQHQAEVNWVAPTRLGRPKREERTTLEIQHNSWTLLCCRKPSQLTSLCLSLQISTTLSLLMISHPALKGKRAKASKFSQLTSPDGSPASRSASFSAFLLLTWRPSNFYNLLFYSKRYVPNFLIHLLPKLFLEYQPWSHRLKTNARYTSIKNHPEPQWCEMSEHFSLVSPRYQNLLFSISPQTSFLTLNSWTDVNQDSKPRPPLKWPPCWLWTLHSAGASSPILILLLLSASYGAVSH